MKGYNISAGYIGFVGKKKMLFSCERDYIEFMEERDEYGRLQTEQLFVEADCD